MWDLQITVWWIQGLLLQRAIIRQVLRSHESIVARDKFAKKVFPTLSTGAQNLLLSLLSFIQPKWSLKTVFL
jgi:hypothetical protein